MELAQSITGPYSHFPTKVERELLSDVVQYEDIEVKVLNKLQADLATLQVQAESPKPKWAIIKTIVGSIKTVLEKAVGGYRRCFDISLNNGS